VLLAYAKMTLYEDLLASEVPDRGYIAGEVAKYFPRPLRRRFAGEIGRHRLKREIAATWVANSVVNRGLEVFVSELQDETGAGVEEIALAYVVARDAFALLPFWAAAERCRARSRPRRRSACCSTPATCSPAGPAGSWPTASGRCASARRWPASAPASPASSRRWARSWPRSRPRR
jgi:hypothetical protein